MYKARILTEVYEDDYKQGELDQVNSWQEVIEEKTKAELKEKIAYLTDCQWSDITQEDINDYDNWTEYWTDTLVNNDNLKPSEFEVKKWQAGKIKLYVQRHHILVSELSEKKASL